MNIFFSCNIPTISKQGLHVRPHPSYSFLCHCVASGAAPAAFFESLYLRRGVRWRLGYPLVTRISAGSVFRPISSRACWLTTRRWRPRRPFLRRLCSLAGRAARCRRGGGDTSNTCLSVYCSLEERNAPWLCWSRNPCDLCACLPRKIRSAILPHPIASPPKLSSVSVFRVDEPTAVSRLTEWSVRLLQWERSSFVKWGMWRITRRRVESLTSRPASRKHCMFRSGLRLSQPDFNQRKYRQIINSLIRDRCRT